MLTLHYSTHVIAEEERAQSRPSHFLPLIVLIVPNVGMGRKWMNNLLTACEGHNLTRRWEGCVVVGRSIGRER